MVHFVCLLAIQPVLVCCGFAMQLDAGVSEEIILMSMDEQSMLVVSYADIKVGVVVIAVLCQQRSVPFLPGSSTDIGNHCSQVHLSWSHTCGCCLYCFQTPL